MNYFKLFRAFLSFSFVFIEIMIICLSTWSISTQFHLMIFWHDRQWSEPQLLEDPQLSDPKLLETKMSHPNPN